MVENDQLRFLFVIDGLDEFDGDPKELVDFAITTSKHSNVKVCVASRPWLVFEDAFEKSPSLLLEHLTRQDIYNYVTAKFDVNKHFARLQKREPRGSQSLIRSIVEKASGVFLWVYLVVESLLQGLSNADRMCDLQCRLDALPADLEALFEKLLNKLDPIYFRHACQFFRLLREHPSATILELSFADDEDASSSMGAKREPLFLHEEKERVGEMIRRLKSRCKGFLEVDEPLLDEDDDGGSNYFTKPERKKIRYIHRTARDYLHSDDVWAVIMKATSSASFNPCERWANAFLWSLKTLRPGALKDRTMWWYMWEPLTGCIEYALRLEESDKKVRLTYLDEVAQVAVESRRTAWERKLIPMPPGYSGKQPMCFLDIAVWLGLDGYVRIKVSKCKASEVKRSCGFAGVISNARPESLLDGRPAIKRALLNTDVGEVLRQQNRPVSFGIFGSKRRRERPQFL